MAAILTGYRVCTSKALGERLSRMGCKAEVVSKAIGMPEATSTEAPTAAKEAASSSS